jgi:hypothetical protein
MEHQIIRFHCGVCASFVCAGHKATLKSHDQAHISSFRMMEYAITGTYLFITFGVSWNCHLNFYDVTSGKTRWVLLMGTRSGFVQTLVCVERQNLCIFVCNWRHFDLIILLGFSAYFETWVRAESSVTAKFALKRLDWIDSSLLDRGTLLRTVYASWLYKGKKQARVISSDWS